MPGSGLKTLTLTRQHNGTRGGGDIMGKVDHIQTSFAGGEFGPSLFGRTDVAQYANACQIVQNFLVRPYGSVLSTPGTRFVREVSVSTLKTRLIKFVFNRSDAYAIEMGPLYFRFYTNGGIVVTTGPTPFTLAHVFTESEIFDVQFTQLNDVMYLTHPDHPPQRLVRSAAASWSIADFDFLGGPFKDDNTNTSTTVSISASVGTINITASTGIFTVSGSTLGHHNTYWKIGTTLTNSTTGLDEQGYVKITYVKDTLTATATVIKTLSIAANDPTSVWAEGAWSAVSGYPARVAFHERRLFFARTAKEPQKVWGSKVFIYDDFALEGAADDDGLNLALASNEANEINWLSSGKSLAVGTYGGPFIINSGSSEPITPSNVTASAEVSFGAEAIVPKKIGHFIYYVQRFKKKLRELFYFWDLDTYKAIDKTIFSPHILGEGIVDMDYQQNPDTILYCVRTDGTLATMTREIDQELTAWAKQTTSGTYSSIAVIPSQTKPYDEVWVIVERWINGAQKRYVEVFEDIVVPDRQDLCLYLHSALTYNAYSSTSSSATSISLSATGGTGSTITLTTSGNYFASGDVGQRIRAIDTLDGSTVGEAKITAFTSGTTVVATVKFAFDASSYAAGKWGLSVQTITGLAHLDAATVGVLADGGVDRPAKTVASEAIQLAYDYFVVSVGLPYDQIIQTLPREAGSAKGTSQGKIQKIHEVAFKVNRSHRGFKVGATSSTLDRAATRDPSTNLGTPELLYTGVIPNISFYGDYAYGAQVYLKNEDPLPIELLSIITKMETFDK